MKRIILCVIAVILSACAFAQNPVYDTVVMRNGTNMTQVYISIVPKSLPIATFTIDSVPTDFDLTSQEIFQIMKGEKFIREDSSSMDYSSLVKILPIVESSFFKITDVYRVEQDFEGNFKLKKLDSKKELAGTKKYFVFSCLFLYLPFCLIILCSLADSNDKEINNDVLRTYTILLLGIVIFLVMGYYKIILFQTFILLMFLVFVVLAILNGLNVIVVLNTVALFLFLISLGVVVSGIENNELYLGMFFELIFCFIGSMAIGFLIRRLLQRERRRFGSLI